MDYKSFITKALKNKDAKALNKYKNLTEEMVEHNKLNKKYLLQNNALSIQQIGGEGGFRNSRKGIHCNCFAT